jgi:hypothetical protein
MFGNEFNQHKANRNSQSNRVERPSRLRTLLYINISVFLLYLALVGISQNSPDRNITSFWMLILLSHAVLVGSLDSLQKLRQAEIERDEQLWYDLEKPKRRLMLSDDGELIEATDQYSTEIEKPKRK